ncbi:MAG: putative ABC transporter permease [Treponema sp.]|nr:putative ABC transporter permease [Treponema sp.]
MISSSSLSAINMPQMPFSKAFVMFILYSFIGWICEEIWCTVGSRKLVKRGMLHGPICPIYGFGALSILYMLYPWRTTFVRLFIASMILTSILEYFTSWLLEKLFHAKWWDYSQMPLNLNGRCCLLNSTAFGIGGIAMEHIMHPAVEMFLRLSFFENYMETISAVLALILSADVLATVHKLVSFATAMEKLKAFSENIRERFENEEWFKKDSFQSMLDSIREHALANPAMFSKKLLESVDLYSAKQKISEFWLLKFPTMTSRDFSSVLEHLKDKMKEKKSK